MRLVAHSPIRADQMSEAGRLRARTRVTTVTRLEATDTHRSTVGQLHLRQIQ